ncbi:MAG TPA: hypothetical protein VFE60_21555 [Roseiarcus sp.]|nr:hypothetical protein [Roseiarcus sp.]
MRLAPILGKQSAAISWVPPDQLAPIVRNSADGERELVIGRLGMPGPSQFGGQPFTNIRNVSSPHWRGWLSARTRCLVPATSFCGDRGGLCILWPA